MKSLSQTRGTRCGRWLQTRAHSDALEHHSAMPDARCGLAQTETRDTTPPRKQTSKFSPSHPGTSPVSNEKKEKGGLSDTPNTHPALAPQGPTENGDEIITTPSTVTRVAKTRVTAVFADSSGATIAARGMHHSTGAGGSFHQPGWDLWLLWETKMGSITIEMILLLDGLC